MRNFRLIHAGLNVAPILAELEAVLEWGLYAERKERDGTAHGDMTDLWIRYFHRDTLTSLPITTAPASACSIRCGTSCRRCTRSCGR